MPNHVSTQLYWSLFFKSTSWSIKPTRNFLYIGVRNNLERNDPLFLVKISTHNLDFWLSLSNMLVIRGIQKVFKICTFSSTACLHICTIHTKLCRSYLNCKLTFRKVYLTYAQIYAAKYELYKVRIYFKIKFLCSVYNCCCTLSKCLLKLVI